MIQLTKLNKLSDIYFRAPLCSMKWTLVPAGVQTQQHPSFKLKCKLRTRILHRKQLSFSLLNCLLVHCSLMKVHLTDVLNEFEKFFSNLRTIKVHFLNEKQNKMWHPFNNQTPPWWLVSMLSRDLESSRPLWT